MIPSLEAHSRLIEDIKSICSERNIDPEQTDDILKLLHSEDRFGKSARVKIVKMMIDIIAPDDSEHIMARSEEGHSPLR